MLNFIIAILAGLVCGVLSGFGIGGGSLLMVWMTAVLSMEQKAAQGINLLYFLPAAGVSLIFHSKNRFVDWRAARWAILGGVILAALGAWIGSAVSAALLRRLFGVFLLFVGVSELRFKTRGSA